MDNKWLDIATLTSVDHDSPHYNERKRAGVFYAESWALVHMLFLSERYPREEFPKLVGSLSVGKPAEATFQEVYGKSFEQVYKDLRAYMRQDRFFSGLVDIKLEKAAEELEVRAATALEAGLVQADLLSSVRGKREQAKQVYLDLAARHPDRWEVEEGLGYLARKDGNNDDALRHLGRAVEFGSTNPETHWAYGYALQNNGASNAEVIAALEGAVRLKPDYKEGAPPIGLPADAGGELRSGAAAFQLGRESQEGRGLPNVSRGVRRLLPHRQAGGSPQVSQASPRVR